MTLVTVRVLEGMERGRVYSRSTLPVSIGREEDNTIQLNDDRISRFHAKLQDHSGRVILTDLDSTNGTRVNGHPIQMRVLQQGDVITVGRCVLLFSERQDDDSLTDDRVENDPTRTAYVPEGLSGEKEDEGDIDFVEPPDPDLGSEPGVLFPLGRPELPATLSGLERVQFSDLLSYIHEQLGTVVRATTEELHSTQGRLIRCDWLTWMRLTALQAELAEYLRTINNPDG
ncbi:MAG: FHA domain-containing protein [Planctomycetota bacterium]